MNVIIYSRSATGNQSEAENSSIQLQENRLRAYCEQNNHNIVGVYSDIAGGGDFKRPQWKTMMDFIKSGHLDVDLILSTRWDRLSRSLGDFLELMEKLRIRGIKVNTIDQPMDVDDIDNLVLLSIYLAVPQTANQMNSVRTKECMRMAKLRGWWMGTPPWGYRNHRNPQGQPTLIPDDNAALVSHIFEDIATQFYSVEDLWQTYRESGLVQCSNQTFLKRLSNVAYTGKIEVPGYRSQPREIVTGKHPAIVPEEVFERVQKVIGSSEIECVLQPTNCL